MRNEKPATGVAGDGAGIARAAAGRVRRKGRPLQLFAYGKPDLFDLAAAYAFGLARNHPFVDGDKRTGFTTAILFLDLNGWRVTAYEADAVLNTLALAAGELGEASYSGWLKANCCRSRL